METSTLGKVVLDPPEEIGGICVCWKQVDVDKKMSKDEYEKKMESLSTRLRGTAAKM